MLKKNTTTRWYLQISIEESHTTMTSELDGAYRCHFRVDKTYFPTQTSLYGDIRSYKFEKLKGYQI